MEQIFLLNSASNGVNPIGHSCNEQCLTCLLVEFLPLLLLLLLNFAGIYNI